MDCAGTSIIGRSRRLSGQATRRVLGSPVYTLVSEEPDYLAEESQLEDRGVHRRVEQAEALVRVDENVGASPGEARAPNNFRNMKLDCE